jgi:D-glycero-D-manno-heptose 1,7-bisphosphate phosphatase
MVIPPRPAVFLDRDGVLNHAVVRNGKPYPPATLAETVLTDGASESVAQLRLAGFVTVMVTNQPDVAKGTQSREVVEAINAMIVQQTGLDAVRVCWCLEGDDCDCYKPKPGMLFDSALELNLDLSKSYMIGDRWRDVGAGLNAGCRTLLIDHNYSESGPFTADWVIRSLPEAVKIIVNMRAESAV